MKVRETASALFIAWLLAFAGIVASVRWAQDYYDGKCVGPMQTGNSVLCWAAYNYLY